MTPMVQWLRRFLTGLFVFLLILTAVVWWGSSLAISMNAPQIASSLETQLGPHFEVGPIGGDIVRGLIVTGVTAGADPEEERDGSAGGPVIQAAKAKVQPDWTTLLRGPLAIRHIAFEDVQIELRRDKSGDILWPPFLSRAAAAQGASLATTPFTWNLIRAEIRYHFPRDGAVPVKVDIPNANGRFAPGDRFQIERCRGTVAESHWELGGSLLLDGTNTLDGFWELRDAGIWTLTQALTGGGSVSAPSPIDSAALPSGVVTGRLSIGGTMGDPDLSGQVIWNEGAIRHFKVDQGELQLQWRPGVLTLKEGVVKAYDGRIAATGSIDLRRYPPVYTLEARSNGIALGNFLNDAGFGKIGLTGTFGGVFKAEGDLVSLDSFVGGGDLTADNGKMANPLYAPGNAMPQTIDYDHLKTNLRVRNRLVNLRETSVNGDDFVLDGSGDVSFDGALDLDAVLTAQARHFIDHPLYGPPIAAMGVQDKEIPMYLTVGGTLQQPQVRTEVDKSALFESAGSSLVDKIKGFVGGLKRAGGAD